MGNGLFCFSPIYFADPLQSAKTLFKQELLYYRQSRITNNSKTKKEVNMVYEKQTGLIELKIKARLTNRELAAALGCSPGAAGAKLTGFIVLLPEERKIIERVCNEALKKLECK